MIIVSRAVDEALTGVLLKESFQPVRVEQLQPELLGPGLQHIPNLCNTTYHSQYDSQRISSSSSSSNNTQKIDAFSIHDNSVHSRYSISWLTRPENSCWHLCLTQEQP